MEKILDCNNITTLLTEDEFKELEKAFRVAEKQNDIAFNSHKHCDSRWSYIMGYMLHTYGRTPALKAEAITHLLDATRGNKNERCAAALYLLGTIYIKQERTKQAAYKCFALAYDSGCELARAELETYTGHSFQYFIDLYKDKNEGGRRTHRKKRELRKRTLYKKRKNRTKRRA